MSGDWLTAEAIEAQYGIKNSSLEYWRTYGCPALNGAKPRVKRAAGPHAPNLYDRRDIDTIAQTPQPAAASATTRLVKPGSTATPHRLISVCLAERSKPHGGVTAVSWTAAGCRSVGS
jgi:hypothetical protein